MFLSIKQVHHHLQYKSSHNLSQIYDPYLIPHYNNFQVQKNHLLLFIHIIYMYNFIHLIIQTLYNFSLIIKIIILFIKSHFIYLKIFNKKFLDLSIKIKFYLLFNSIINIFMSNQYQNKNHLFYHYMKRVLNDKTEIIFKVN